MSLNETPTEDPAKHLIELQNRVTAYRDSVHRIEVRREEAEKKRDEIFAKIKELGYESLDDLEGALAAKRTRLAELLTEFEEKLTILEEGLKTSGSKN